MSETSRARTPTSPGDTPVGQEHAAAQRLHPDGSVRRDATEASKCVRHVEAATVGAVPDVVRGREARPRTRRRCPSCDIHHDRRGAQLTTPTSRRRASVEHDVTCRIVSATPIGPTHQTRGNPVLFIIRNCAHKGVMMVVEKAAKLVMSHTRTRNEVHCRKGAARGARATPQEAMHDIRGVPRFRTSAHLSLPSCYGQQPGLGVQ